jgi:bifunctional DNase/RNase
VRRAEPAGNGRRGRGPGRAWDNQAMASEEPLPGTKLVEMVVESVRVHMLSSRHVVILKETERDRYLPIWIGPWEASAIAMKLQGLAPDRPLTHDLFAAALEGLGARVDRVIISSLAEETFHARLLLEHDGRTVEVDARPSDSLALAVRAGGRIFVVESVLDQAALGADGGVGDEEGEGVTGIALESTGEQIVDPRLDVFRDFVNSLDIDPGTGEPRASGS